LLRKLQKIFLLDLFCCLARKVRLSDNFITVDQHSFKVCHLAQSRGKSNDAVN
jgi:hypothetical protein